MRTFQVGRARRPVFLLQKSLVSSESLFSATPRTCFLVSCPAFWHSDRGCNRAAEIAEKEESMREAKLQRMFNATDTEAEVSLRYRVGGLGGWARELNAAVAGV